MANFPEKIDSCQKGPKPRSVLVDGGQIFEVPSGWELVPPGDPALTRRIKAGGKFWAVSEKRGRKIFSGGIYAPTEMVEPLRRALEIERLDPSYQQKLAKGKEKREIAQDIYVKEFTGKILEYLSFPPNHCQLAEVLAEKIAAHATPVGSGTVARTKRIPIESRAEAAVIAWMRHQTTGYDNMHVPRVKGSRREIRRMLAAQSKKLLENYRKGIEPVRDCPLLKALGSP